ncbi:uncharacterized protein KD926_002990 [Aspergillus affinis]|uniref:uncharacterized protein n=1 Tax=Aspergillus affinis TaxID=1070780 RepID=UPI0022FF0DE6|nr:uncharacterized protein KD926_002990 [Aspergillus affinis]KAI9043640.1 hypothetical protein KD926_002990 [Aspergillus affinis]
MTQADSQSAGNWMWSLRQLQSLLLTIDDFVAVMTLSLGMPDKVGDPYWLQWEDNKNGQHTYCCTWFGSVDNRSYGCDGQSTFTLPDNGVLFGHALLQNVSSFNAPEVTNATNATKAEPSGGSSSREIAIGAGLGVSLGTLMLAFLAWALFERRERFRARSTPAPTYNVTHGHPSSYVYPHGTGMTKPPVELDHNVPVSEIMGRER